MIANFHRKIVPYFVSRFGTLQLLELALRRRGLLLLRRLEQQPLALVGRGQRATAEQRATEDAELEATYVESDGTGAAPV